MPDLTKCSIRPSLHARDKMTARAVNTEKIRETILLGMKRIFKDKVISSRHDLDVVYKPKPCNLFIITVYWRGK